MKYIEIKAPAKINIGLFITDKRDDGYHNLYTLFYPINDLFDELYFEKSESFSFSCNELSIPVDENNLVVKAVRILESLSKKEIKVDIRLVKNIPSQAGLGGGSSDAAATLISINEMFNLGLKYEKLINIALMLGSDVPFFIKSKPAIGKSRGEILNHIDLVIKQPVLIVNPRINISTKEAFGSVKPKKCELNYHDVISEGELNFSEMKLVVNDFEKSVFPKYPEIERIKNGMVNQGALYASMSGSGSTVYGIFENIESAEKMKELFPSHYFCWISNPDH